MMRLRRSDDGMTQEHKDRDEDGRNENTRLICLSMTGVVHLEFLQGELNYLY